MFYSLILFLGALIGFRRYHRLLKPFQLLTQLLTWTLIIEISSDLLKNYLGTNFPFYHFLLLVQFIYFLLIFYYFLSKHIKTRNIVTFIGVYFTLLSIFVTFFYHGFYEFPSINTLFFSIYTVLGSLILLLKMMENPISISPLQQGIFWFSVGTLIFYSITFLFFGYYNVHLNDMMLFPSWGYGFIRIANYLLYSCYFLALFFDSQKSTVNSHEPR